MFMTLRMWSFNYCCYL